MTAKVDREMVNQLDEEAERLGVYRAEVLRLYLDASTELVNGEVGCPHCGESLQAEL